MMNKMFFLALFSSVFFACNNDIKEEPVNVQQKQKEEEVQQQKLDDFSKELEQFSTDSASSDSSTHSI